MAQKIPLKERCWRIVISITIIGNIAAILLGSSRLVHTSPEVKRFLTPYLWWTRLRQDWILFVPTPRTYAIKYRADVLFKDGSRTSWTRPYPPNWGFFQRQLCYQFQKWDLASNRIDAFKPLQRDHANFILRMFWKDENPVVWIKIFRSEADWPPPSPTGYVGHDESELRWRDIIIAVFPVKDGVLL